VWLYLRPHSAYDRRPIDCSDSAGSGGTCCFRWKWTMWVRLVRDGDFFGVPRTLASFRIRSGSLTASTSALSQLAQQIEFARRLVDDPLWRISVVDRILGRVNCYDMQMRRTLLFLISNLRASRRRRQSIGSMAAGKELDNSQQDGPPTTVSNLREAITAYETAPVISGCGRRKPQNASDDYPDGVSELPTAEWRKK
jgi:hypothetical protein